MHINWIKPFWLKCVKTITLETLVIFYCVSSKAIARICITALYFVLICLPQELIQNAEDAGATEVRFLYDETQYGTETLWSKDMAQYQGKYKFY